MADEERDSLSAEFEELIRIYYPLEAQSAVRTTLMSYGAAKPGPGTDRVRYDLLLLGAGDPARLNHLADLAARDSRDIMSQEYFWADGRSYPHPWARRHAVNRDWDHPPKHEKAALATAELFFRSQPSGSSGAKRQVLPSVFLTFSDRIPLLTFADRVFTFAQSDVALDLSDEIRYQGMSTAKRTILRCPRTDLPETLIHDGEVLYWDGNADYWIECRQKCRKLAESGRGFQEMLPRGTADQQVRVSLSPLVTGG